MEITINLEDVVEIFDTINGFVIVPKETLLEIIKEELESQSTAVDLLSKVTFEVTIEAKTYNFGGNFYVVKDNSDYALENMDGDLKITFQNKL